MLTWITNIKNRYSTPIWIRFFGDFLTSITGTMLAPFLVIYLHDKLGGSVFLPMLVVGLQPLSDIFLTLIGGGITDKIGRRSIILLALLLQSVAMAGFIIADSVWFFAILYVLNGFGRSLYIPASRAQIADATDESMRSEVFAVINTIGAIGMTIGPLIGFAVYSKDPAIIFALEAAALFIYFIVVYLKLPETAPIAQSNIAKVDKKIKWKLTSLKKLVSKHQFVLGLMVFSLPISFFYAQMETNFRIYIQDLFPNYLFILSVIFTGKAIMSIAFQILLVKWTEKLHMRTIVIISYSCYIIAAILYGHGMNLTILLAAQLLLTIGESVGLNHFLQYVSKLAPDTMRGRYFSMYGIHWDISRTFGPIIGATLLVHIGGAFLFYICGALLVIGGVAQLLFVDNIEGKRIRLSVKKEMTF